MPLSNDPEKRERQLQNLRPNWPKGGKGASGGKPKRSPERSADQRPSSADRRPKQRPIEYPTDTEREDANGGAQRADNGGPGDDERPRRGGFFRSFLTGELD